MRRGGGGGGGGLNRGGLIRDGVLFQLNVRVRKKEMKSASFTVFFFFTKLQQQLIDVVDENLLRRKVSLFSLFVYFHDLGGGGGLTKTN